jgi:hypothetical protein
MSDKHSINLSEDVNAADRIVERFSLHAAAREILQRSELLPGSRSVWCLYRLQPRRTEVQVFRSVEHRGTFYGNLAVCGSLWNCPLCAAKISERRRVELKQLQDAHQAAGGTVVFITLTFSHTFSETLPDILKRTAKALKLFKGDRAFQALKSFYDVVGTIRATEVTWGYDNGWHVHFHELWYLKGIGHDLSMLESSIYHLWHSACLCAGLGEPSKLRGVTVQGGDYAAHYAGKWGLEQEMVKSHVKKGRGERFTPWDFLRLYRDGDTDGQAVASQKFEEYAAAFKGRKQLVFSRGLKALYRIEDSSDQEIAEKLEDTARLLGVLTLAQWRRVLKYGDRGLLLKRAMLEGWPGVVGYLEQLPGLSQSERQEAVKDYLRTVCL